MKKQMILKAILLVIFVTAFSASRMDVQAREVILVTPDETYQYGSLYDFYCPEDNASNKSKNILTLIGECVDIEGLEETWNEATDNLFIDFGDTIFDIWNYVENSIDEGKTMDETLKGYAIMKIEELNPPIHTIKSLVTDLSQKMMDDGETVSKSTVSMIEAAKEQEKTIEEYFSYNPDQKTKMDKQIEQIVEKNMGITANADNTGSANETPEVQQPDFDKYGLTCNVEEWQEYDYHTVCYDNPDAPTVGRAVFVSERVPSIDSMPSMDGYEWLTVEIVAVFGDDNAWEYGVSTSSGFEDYYNIKLHDDTLTEVVIDNRTFDQYTVIFNGVEYDNCLMFTDGGAWSGWSEREITFTLSAAFRVPVGYDGTVVGLRNSSVVWEDGKYIYDLDNTDSLFYRIF